MINKRLKYKTPGLPDAQGLYDPQNEHDACGVGMVVDVKNRASYKIVSKFCSAVAQSSLLELSYCSMLLDVTLHQNWETMSIF